MWRTQGPSRESDAANTKRQKTQRRKVKRNARERKAKAKRERGGRRYCSKAEGRLFVDVPHPVLSKNCRYCDNFLFRVRFRFG